MSMILDGSLGVTFNDASLQGAAASPYVLKNRIINGAMEIDQRNAGASFTPTNSSYGLDRWRYQVSQTSKLTSQQSSVAPAGFINSLLVTSSSAYSVLAADFFILRQRIEGYNVADLNWGTANAATVTISFWVRSSLTGTFGGALANSAANRSYPFTYTISSADTWEQKSITIAGDTTGTWLADNSTGIAVNFSLGVGATFSGTAGSWAAADYASATGATSVVGTNGATFYITGVQLEQNTSATPFERRLYGQELANCQRYYYRIFPNGNASLLPLVGDCASTTVTLVNMAFPVEMRTSPTALEQSGTANHYAIRSAGTATNCSAVPVFNNVTNQYGAGVTLTVASGLTAGNVAVARTGSANGTNAYLGWSAEL
jgi:hypothetical protein